MSDFKWIENYQPRTNIAKKLLNLYVKAKPRPVWTPELDAALRIILCATDGSLASRQENLDLLSTIQRKINNQTLYVSDLILLADDAVSDTYFFCSNPELLSHSHRTLVLEAKQHFTPEIRVKLYG